MRLLAFFALITLVASAPTSNEIEEDNEKLVINKEFFYEGFKIYTADHDIIRLLYPINALNIEDDDDDSKPSTSNETSSETTDEKIIFFVEADLTNGIEYKGLSVFKNGNVTKILPTGTSVIALQDNSKIVYFGATDGLYKYNAKENTAEKYGPITDNIIDIAVVNGSDVIYILTDKRELFKITENGTKKELISDVVGAKQIILDLSNNLYFYSEDNKPYVISKGGIKKIEGLPSDITDIKLINAPFFFENAIPAVIGNTSYLIYANETSELTDFEFKVKPSAYSMEAGLIQYYAYNKSIYEYNVLAILFGTLNEVFEDVKSYLDNNKSQIETIATRSRSGLRGNEN